MTPVRLHAADAVVDGLSIGSYKALEKRRQRAGYDALQEFDLQYQIPISGTATPDGALFETQVEFEAMFFNAQTQRDSPLTMPHFTCGLVVISSDITSGGSLLSSAGVVAEAAVVGWLLDDETGSFMGARIIGSCKVPSGESYTADFRGLLNVNFQGYGTRLEPGVGDDADA